MNKKFQIACLLALALSLRLYHLHSPIIGVHSWRQADTAAMARNFHENGYRFLYPQIDWGGDSEGYVETEFPAYPFAVALFYGIFGVSEAYGRLLSVIWSLIAIYFLYRLVRKQVNENVAIWSAVFFSILPLNVYYSRTFMPESALVMSSILGVYFFSNWLSTEKAGYFALSALFVALACLLKITALVLGLPLLYLAWLKFGWRFAGHKSLWLYGLLVLAPVFLWYYHAHQLFLQYGLTFRIWEYGTDKWGNWQLLLTPGFWDKIIFRTLAERFLTWAGFPIFLVGLFLRRQTRGEKLFDYWLAALVIFLLIVAKGNYVHEYYQLPFMIPASVFMGKVYGRHFSLAALKGAKSLVLAVCLMGILLLAAHRYHSYMKKEDPQSSDTYQLASEVKRSTLDHARIIAVDLGNPTLLYLCHRKGWQAYPNELDEQFLRERIERGAQFVVGNHRDFESETDRSKLRSLLSDPQQVLFDDGRSFIVRLSE